MKYVPNFLWSLHRFQQWSAVSYFCFHFLVMCLQHRERLLTNKYPSFLFPEEEVAEFVKGEQVEDSRESLNQKMGSVKISVYWNLYLNENLSSWFRHVLGIYCVQQKFSINANLYFHWLAGGFHPSCRVDGISKETIPWHFASDDPSNHIAYQQCTSYIKLRTTYI